MLNTERMLKPKANKNICQMRGIEHELILLVPKYIGKIKTSEKRNSMLQLKDTKKMYYSGQKGNYLVEINMIPTQKLKHKKEKVQNHRIAKQTKLGTNEDFVRAFKEKAKLGIDYSCCCCDRLLFQNQVQRCERNLYAKNEKAKDVAAICRINIATRALSHVHKIALSQSYGFVIHVTGKF